MGKTMSRGQKRSTAAQSSRRPGNRATASVAPNTRVSDADRAILQLKLQRDELHQYKAKLESTLDKEREVAKQLLQEGKKDRAKLLLKKKRFQEYLLDQSEKQLDSILHMCDTVEFHKIEVQAVKSIDQANEALKKIQKMITLEDIEKILEETQEGISKQTEIDRILSLSTAQEQEILEQGLQQELEQMASSSSETPAVAESDSPVGVVPRTEGTAAQESSSPSEKFPENNDATVPAPGIIMAEEQILIEMKEEAEEILKDATPDNTLHISSITAVSNSPKGFGTGVESELEFIASQMLNSTRHTNSAATSSGAISAVADVEGMDSSASALPLKSTAEISDLLPDVSTGAISEDLDKDTVGPRETAETA